MEFDTIITIREVKDMFETINNKLDKLIRAKERKKKINRYARYKYVPK